ncbi:MULTISPECIES: lipid asymmetry maintenance protein MlaB [Musicola]|uniref:Anti-sigma B factor antagonist n=1 Tax=Musicola paradisiaca (strain Ech703) TaxID=579405 RepID=C6C476_MUSP7|nr:MULTISPECIES: lipid asymmetry maintenance protein MlaB [Musicola]ACS87403.1 putative anti-sigma B factor antagonist [Musicola paradisiaca Ech703]
MANSLTWKRENGVLQLEGDLDRDTLLPLWQQREALLNGVGELDLSRLRRVDSSGLALLLHFHHQQQQQEKELNITGASDRLSTLIQLYNLSEIIPIRQAG